MKPTVGGKQVTNKSMYLVLFIICGALFSSCGISEEDAQATEIAELTANAPTTTYTPMPTDTQTPTMTPTITSTPTLIPTMTPTPSIYDDPVLQYLGWLQEDIIDEFGEPDTRAGIPGPGGEAFYYSERNIKFIFAGEDGVVNNLEIYSDVEVLGVRVGMTFDEIEEILGPPESRGVDEMRGGHSVMMVYKFGEENKTELEFHFYSSSDDTPTSVCMIFWRKYWW